MKRHVQLPGVRKWAGEDFIELQSEPLKALDGFFAQYGPCIVEGVEITANGKFYNLTEGLVCLSGENHEKKTVTMIVPFKGAKEVVMPLYLTLKYKVKERVYADERVKPVAYEYYADYTTVAPANAVSYLELKAAGNIRFTDALQDDQHRFITDDERISWNARETPEGAQAKSDKALADSKKYADQKDESLHKEIVRTTITQLGRIVSTEEPGKQSLDEVDTGMGINYRTAGTGATGSFISFGYPGYPVQIISNYQDSWNGDATLYFRTKNSDPNVGKWNQWHQLWSSGNFDPDSKVNTTDARLTDARKANGGNADTVAGIAPAPAGTIQAGKLASYDASGFLSAQSFKDHSAKTEPADKGIDAIPYKLAGDNRIYYAGREYFREKVGDDFFQDRATKINAEEIDDITKTLKSGGYAVRKSDYSGTILSFNTSSSVSPIQLYVDHFNTDAKNIFWRNGTDNNRFTDPNWRKVWDSYNFDADSCYQVPKEIKNINVDNLVKTGVYSLSDAQQPVFSGSTLPPNLAGFCMLEVYNSVHFMSQRLVEISGQKRVFWRSWYSGSNATGVGIPFVEVASTATATDSKNGLMSAEDKRVVDQLKSSGMKLVGAGAFRSSSASSDRLVFKSGIITDIKAVTNGTGYSISLDGSYPADTLFCQVTPYQTTVCVPQTIISTTYISLHLWGLGGSSYVKSPFFIQVYQISE